MMSSSLFTPHSNWRVTAGSAVEDPEKAQAQTSIKDPLPDASLPIRGGLKRVRHEVENMAALLDDIRM